MIGRKVLHLNGFHDFLLSLVECPLLAVDSIDEQRIVDDFRKLIVGIVLVRNMVDGLIHHLVGCS